MKTIAKYDNCFQNNRPVTINSMFNECSAVHLHSNALQVIRVHGAVAPMSFQLKLLVTGGRFVVGRVVAMVWPRNFVKLLQNIMLSLQIHAHSQCRVMSLPVLVVIGS